MRISDWACSAASATTIASVTDMVAARPVFVRIRAATRASGSVTFQIGQGRPEPTIPERLEAFWPPQQAGHSAAVQDDSGHVPS